MSEFIEVTSPSTLKNLQAVNSELLKTIAGVKEVNANMINIKTPSGSDSALKSLNAEYKKQEKLLQDAQKLLIKEQQERKKTVQAILDQAKSYQGLEAQKAKAIAQSEKEAAAMVKTENAYERVRAKIASMLPVYNDLKTKVELGIRLSAKETAQLELLEKRMIKYREVLNSVNKGYGNYALEVGNYQKANSNLSNSIGQISRELPNFGQSFQIGVLSLTNNVGALIDSIKQVKAQNLELSSQGQATKSVFSQILSSVFSWQTALFIGIGIFSAYSKEIGNFVSSLFSANSALKANERAFVDAYEARMRYNGATADSTKKTQKEYEDFILLIKGIKDVTKSQEERLNMAKRFKDAYPGYLKNFSEEQIIASANGKANKELSKTIVQLTGDIKERNLALSESEETSKTFSLLTDIKEEFNFREAQNKLINTSSKSIREFVKQRSKDRAHLLNDDENFVNKFGKITFDELGTYSTREIAVLKIRYNVLVKEFNAERAAVQQKLLNTSLLDFKEDKGKGNNQRKERLALTFSAIKSEYELQKAIIERQRTEASDRMNNADSTLEARLKARQEFSKKSIEILDLEIKEERALLAEKYNDDLIKNNQYYKNANKDNDENKKNDLISEKEYNAEKAKIFKQYSENIQTLNERVNNEQQTADSKNSIKFNDLLNQDLAYYKKIEEEKVKFSQSTAKMIIDLEIKKYKAIVDNANGENYTLAIRQKAFEQIVRLQRAELDLAKIRELANSKSEEETANIIQKYKDLNYEIDKTETPLQKAQKATEEWIKSNVGLEKSLNNIGLSSAKMFLDFDKHGQSTFDKLLEGADTMREKFAITFQAVGDVAQEVFNKISELSNANFQNEYANLQKQKEVALLFAGDSIAAKEEIEKQAEERRKQIARREFQAKKQQALFNITIDTAQAIVAALPNIPLSIAIGAIGAIQLALVSSQQAPQFWTGTDNAPEGLAWTQERGQEIITDSKGNIKDFGDNKGARLTHLNKGDKVLNNEKTMDYLMFNNGLNNILNTNSISQPNIEVNNTIDLTPVVNAINNKETSNVSIDRKGIKEYVTNGRQITERMNNRVNFKGKSI